jgi:hypothetical protein
MDSDSKEDLHARRDFILNSSIDAYQCTILTPLPGTVLFESLEKENRIVLNNYPADWYQYDGMVATSNSLEITDIVIWLIYRIAWQKMVTRLSAK